MTQASLFGIEASHPAPFATMLEAAEKFCELTPHRELPYARRDWGGPLHSLCSYKGKLKPAIAHFLVSWFTQPGDIVLDPMCGVGTIPLEARRLGRHALGNDLSPLAVSVSRAKVEGFKAEDVEPVVSSLAHETERGPNLAKLQDEVDVGFGLNRAIRDYFHPDTLREILLARRYFLQWPPADSPCAVDVVRSNVLHILHGNRPYALSRRSHPITPLAPTGPTEYRPLVRQLRTRLDRLMPRLVEFSEVSSPGRVVLGDFRRIDLPTVDWVITSPPFSHSFRFWRMNWMRLWFAGWEPDDFKTEPAAYLETQQKSSFKPYTEFAESMAGLLRAGGGLILHLGETASENMIHHVLPEIDEEFEVVYSGRESVHDTETHGLTDKGATKAHWYVFAVKRG